MKNVQTQQKAKAFSKKLPAIAALSTAATLATGSAMAAIDTTAVGTTITEGTGTLETIGTMLMGAAIVLVVMKMVFGLFRTA